MEKIRLGDITNIQTGKLDANAQDIKGKYPFFTCGEETLSINEAAFDTEAVLLAGNGNFGVKYYKGKFNAYQRTYVIEPKGINGKWLYYLLIHHIPKITTGARGSTIKYLRISDITDSLVPFTPPSLQEKVVAKIEELFSELDNGIASLKTAQQQLNIYRQSLLKHAFEGKLTEQWRKDNADQLETPEQLLVRIQQERETRYQQQLKDWQQAVKDWETKGKEDRKPTKPKKQTNPPTQVSETEINELPKLPNSYIYTYLSNLGDLGRGKSKHRPRNDPKLFGGKYPFIQTGEVKAAGHKITSFTQTYSDFGLKQSKLWPKGTLCITIAANIAETAFLDFDACFPDSVVGFSAYSLVSPQYVELFIKAARVKIEAYAPATAQKNINLRTLEGLVVPYCSYLEQQEIVNQLEEKLSIIDQNEKEIEDTLAKAELLRQSILKKAFSGQLVTNNPK